VTDATGLPSGVLRSPATSETCTAATQDATGLPRGVLRSLLLVKHAQLLLKMPRACPVECHVRSYRKSGPTSTGLQDDQDVAWEGK
jgi:hypothetical protein